MQGNNDVQERNEGKGKKLDKKGGKNSKNAAVAKKKDGCGVQ